MAQASDLGGGSSWQDVLGPHLDDRWRLERLTINYRTPAEIAEVAAGRAGRDRPGTAATAPGPRDRPGAVAARAPAGDLPAVLGPLTAREASRIGAGTWPSSCRRRAWPS